MNDRERSDEEIAGTPMGKRRTQTEVAWSTRTDETDDGHLTQFTLVRRATVFPVTAAGHRQWQRGEATTQTLGPFPASDIPAIIAELAGITLYYADGSRAQDRVLEGRGTATEAEEDQCR